MVWYGWPLLIAVFSAAAYLHSRIQQGANGPSRCMGCGKCDHTGVCVLTNQPVGGVKGTMSSNAPPSDTRP